MPHQWEKEAEEWMQNRNPDYLPLMLAFKIQDDNIYPLNKFTEAASGGKSWKRRQKSQQAFQLNFVD